MHTHTHTHTHRFTAFGPGRPGQAGASRNTHPLTPILSSDIVYQLPPFTTEELWRNIHRYTYIKTYKEITHTHPFNGPYSKTTQVSQYQKGKTNLDFTEARDSEWQWHQLGHMQVCTSLQTENQTSTPPLCFLQAGCPSCRPTNGQGTEGKRLQNYKEITWSITIVQCPLDNFIIKKSHRHLTSYDRSVDQQQNASGSWIF